MSVHKCTHLSIYLSYSYLYYIILYWLIGLVSREFTNGPVKEGSIPARVIQKLKKWYFIPSCLTLSIMIYGPWVKWCNPGKGVVPFPTPQFNSFLKMSLFKFTYFINIYIYIYIYIYIVFT